jgi:hypothetical protein
MAETFGKLVGRAPPSINESSGPYSLLQNIDFDHPALGKFRDPRWRDFTQVHFWKHRQIAEADLPEGSKVIARFDRGDPAWIEIPVGKGSLVVMMAGWHPRDSQLSLSTKFVPLLFSIFADAGSRVGVTQDYFVGDSLPIAEGTEEILLPSGQSQTLAANEAFRPDAPGIYRLPDGPALAVNLRPSESELTPLGKEALIALGVPVGNPTASRPSTAPSSLRNQQSEGEQNLWRWAVILLLSLLVIESWLASRAPTPAAPSLSS